MNTKPSKEIAMVRRYKHKINNKTDDDDDDDVKLDKF